MTTAYLAAALRLAQEADPDACWAYDPADVPDGLPCNVVLCTHAAAEKLYREVPGSYEDEHPHPPGHTAVVIPDPIPSP